MTSEQIAALVKEAQQIDQECAQRMENRIREELEDSRSNE